MTASDNSEALTLTAGQRLASRVCSTEVVIVKAPTVPVDLRCGGEPLAELGVERAEGAAPRAGFDGGSQTGKRYEDTDSGLELLVSKAGDGTLSIGEEPLPLKSAKPLPSSD